MDKNASFLEELSGDKPESFKEENFEPVRISKGRIFGIVTFVLLVIAAILLVPHFTDITVPDMSKWQYEEIEAWATKYHDNTIINGLYSEEIPQNNVLSQDVKPGSRIAKSKTLTVNYSLGADPEEYIEIPNIKNMSLTKIKKWITDNQLSGISIKQEESEVVLKDKVINYELIDGTADEFKRKNRMIIYISSGPINLEETLLMPDLYGKTRAEVKKWSKEVKLPIKIKEIFNQDVEFGKVCDQNIKKDMKISRKDSVEVFLSRGKALFVPDFTGMTRNEAQELAKLLGINVFLKLVISGEKADTVISQDVPAKTEIDIKQIVTVEVAREEGRVIVPDFRGLSSAEANNLAALYGIKVFLRNLEEVGEAGTVVSQNVTPGIKLEQDRIITLKLKESNKKITVPDFIKVSKNKAVQLAKNLEIELLFNEEETMTAKNQTVIGQDIKAKSITKPGATILLTIAVNSGIKAVNVWDMKLRDLKAWALQNGITLNVVENYSDSYPLGSIFYQDCEEGNWIPSSKTLTVYYSLGEVFVPDFTGKSKSEIIKWQEEVNGKGADIHLSYKEDNNTSKGKGIITKQSISEKKMILDATIDIWVSVSDNGVLIKNYEGTDVDDFKLWCDSNSIPYIIKECYQDEYPAGTLYGQNYKDTYLPKDTYLKINYSLGKVYIDDFIGKNKSELVKWQKEVNKNNADIQIEYNYMYSLTVDKGEIINQSVKDAELKTGSKITVTISSGLVN